MIGSIVNKLVNEVEHVGRLVREEVTSDYNVEEKRTNDYVTSVDLRAAQELKAFAETNQLGYEGEELGSSRGDKRLVADPLDGTTNFTRGIPFYDVAAAVYDADSDCLEVGVVHWPERGVTYAAERHSGAYMRSLDDSEGWEEMSGSDTESLSEALLCYNRSHHDREARQVGSQWFQTILRETHTAPRILGTGPLDMCLTANGRFDGLLSPHAEDVHCAGYVVMEESGLSVTDKNGCPMYKSMDSVVAAPRGLHREILETVVG